MYLDISKLRATAVVIRVGRVFDCSMFSVVMTFVVYTLYLKRCLSNMIINQ
nr:MAG TPA: hypothetical protein [Microviridae sp.]